MSVASRDSSDVETGSGLEGKTVANTLYEDDEEGLPSIWSLYLKETVIWDEKLAEHWKAQIDSILIFTGLFSATVAAFIVESYKRLQPDSGDVTVDLLNYLSQVASITNGTRPPSLPSIPNDKTFQAPSTMVHVNVLWFLSLTFSLASAVGAIMMQQCARFYQTEQFREQRAVRGNPQLQARVHAYLLNGLERWLMIEALNFLPTMMHAAVFLFFGGLVEFLSTINQVVYHVVLAFVVLFAAVYTIFSVIPVFNRHCPYHTPLTVVLRWVLSGTIVLLTLFGLILTPLSYIFGQHTRTAVSKFFSDWLKRIHAPLSEKASSLKYIDRSILRKTLEMVHPDNTAFQDFIGTIPSFLRSHLVDDPKATVYHLLITNDLYNVNLTLRAGLGRLLTTSTNLAKGVPDIIRSERALTCLETLWRVLEALRREYPSVDWWRRVLKGDVAQAMVELKDDAVPTVALSAWCTGSLASHILLDQFGKDTVNQEQGKFLEWWFEFVGAPELVREQCQTEDGISRNGSLVLLTSYVAGIIPYLRVLPELDETVEIAWRTLFILADEIDDPRAADAVVREEFLDLWRMVDGLYDGRYDRRLRERLMDKLQKVYDAIRARDGVEEKAGASRVDELPSLKGPSVDAGSMV